MTVQVLYDLSHDAYLEINALSSSAIKTINVSVSDYIESMNDDNSTQAKDLGRAYHKRILEGETAFNDAYTIKPNKDDYLNTISDIKSFLDDMGMEYKKSGSKEYFEDLARMKSGALYSDIIENETREFISEDQYQRINKYGDYFDSHFKNYLTEVTVLWDWDGVPCKARFDAVNENQIIDLKTYTNPSGFNLQTLPAKMIANYRYDIQAVFYAEAHKQAFKSKNPEFEFLWVQSQGGFNAMKTRLSPDSHELFQTNGYWQQAVDDILKAKDLYLKHIINQESLSLLLHDDYLEDHHLPTYHFKG